MMEQNTRQYLELLVSRIRKILDVGTDNDVEAMLRGIRDDFERGERATESSVEIVFTVGDVSDYVMDTFSVMLSEEQSAYILSENRRQLENQLIERGYDIFDIKVVRSALYEAIVAKPDSDEHGDSIDAIVAMWDEVGAPPSMSVQALAVVVAENAEGTMGFFGIDESQWQGLSSADQAKLTRLRLQAVSKQED